MRTWVEHDNEKYFAFQAEGNAAQFIMPFAKKLCVGVGYDIGCSKVDWSLPGSIPIDTVFDNIWDATNLPIKEVDYIFSSHCLEHISDWVGALLYWQECLRDGGVLFLYLPHYDQKYWRPWNNRKHVNVLTAEILMDCLWSIGFANIEATGRDLNHSFAVYAEKKWDL